MIRSLLTAVLVLTAACGQADPLPGYRAASPDDRGAIMRTVERYYAVRSRAAVTGDVGALFAVYPQLAADEDRAQGINVDGSFVQRMRALAVTEVAVGIEDREPMRAYTKGDSAIAYVHGLETWTFPRGGPTLGEIQTRIDLHRGGDGWVVERTDEVMLGERPPRTPTP